MRVIFRLKRYWEMPDGSIVDLEKEILEGRKRIEYREASKRWAQLLFSKEHVHYIMALQVGLKNPIDVTCYAKVSEAWFIVAFPKGNVPRIEAEISRIDLAPTEDPDLPKFHIHFKNIKRIEAKP